MSESWLEHVLRRAKPEMADECGSSRERLALLENNDDVGAAVATWPLVVLSPCECHAREGVMSSWRGGACVVSMAERGMECHWRGVCGEACTIQVL